MSLTALGALPTAGKKNCQFKILLFHVLPSSSMAEGRKKDLCPQTSISKGNYELGDVVSQDDRARAVPLTAGITPAISQAE